MEVHWDFLSDSTEQTRVRYVTLVTPQLSRFDLAIVTTDRFYGKKLIIDLMRNVCAIVGPDDLANTPLIARTYRLSEDEAEELVLFLQDVIGPITYPE